MIGYILCQKMDNIFVFIDDVKKDVWIQIVPKNGLFLKNYFQSHQNLAIASLSHNQVLNKIDVFERPAHFLEKPRHTVNC